MAEASVATESQTVNAKDDDLIEKPIIEEEDNVEFENYNDDLNNVIEDYSKKVEKLNAMYNKDLAYLSQKITKYTEALPKCMEMMDIINSIEHSQSSLPFKQALGEGHDLMRQLIVLKSRNNNDILTEDLTDIPNSLNISQHQEPFDFYHNIDENINALKGIDNCYVGHRIKDVLRWGKIVTIQKETLLFSAFEILDKEYEPNKRATLVHFNWVKPLINTYKMFFFKIEVDKEYFKSSRKGNAECPKSFMIFINLNSDFLESPYAKKFYYLCTGEKGKSYVNSVVNVSEDYIKVEDIIEGDLIPCIPDLGDNNWTSSVGSVSVNRKQDSLSGFNISLKEKEMNKEYVQIGSLYENSVLQYFKPTMNLKISDCGYVIV